MSNLRHLLDLYAEAKEATFAGDEAKGLSLCRLVLQQDPLHVASWHLLGCLQLRLGRVAASVEALNHAVELQGDDPVFRNNYGVALRAVGRLIDAAQQFQTAVQLKPDYADAVSNLGLVSSDQGLANEAARHFRRALEIQPDHGDAAFNLGNLLRAGGKPSAAVPYYRIAIAAHPARPDRFNNLGIALLESGEAAEAVGCFEKAAALDGNFAEASFNLARAYGQLERIGDARRTFEEASRRRGGKKHWRLHALGLCPTVFHTVRELDEFRHDLEGRLDAARAESFDVDDLAREGFVPPFNLAHQGRNNRELMEKYASLVRGSVRRVAPQRVEGKPRVGFVVLAGHVASFIRNVGGIVSRLDPGRFQIVVLCGANGLESLRKQLARDDIEFRPISGTFSAAAGEVADAGCRVLYHHKIGTDSLSYLLPFARPAPVQWTSWTTHGTSGASEVDYYLSSELVERADADSDYTESLHRLNGFPNFETRPGQIARADRTEFGLPASGPLYICPQRLAKFHPAEDERFFRILDENPSSSLVLLEGNSRPAFEQLRNRFGKMLGAAANRVVWIPNTRPGELRRLLSVCDVLLDMHHYSACLTAYDAFAVDLPILTLPGRYQAERYCRAFYQRLGMPDMIANSSDRYVALATRLGGDADFRDSIRAEIRRRKDVLFEDPKAVSGIETFLESVMQHR